MRRALVLLCGLFALAPSGASAHPNLASSRPAAGSNVSGSVSDLVLTFTERIELRYTTVVLITTNGDTIRGGVTFGGTDDRAVRVQLAEPLATGTYRVVWRTAGADGHVVGAEYGFTIGAAPARPANVMGPADSDLDAHHANAELDVNQRPVAVLVRWLNFAFVILLGGGLSFPFLLRGVPRKSPLSASRAAGRRARRLTLVAASVVLVLAVLRLELQSSMLHGRENAWDLARLSPLIGQTAWGRAWAIQVAGAALAAVAIAIAPFPRRPTWAMIGFVLLAGGLALGGHAAAVEGPRVLAWAADTAHVVAASLWLGSLAYVLAIALPIALGARIYDDLAGVVHGFSAMALVAAPIVVLSGGTSALLHLGGLRNLWLSDYGRLLALKVALVGLTGAMGLYNWRRVIPTLGTAKGSRHFRLSAAGEIGIALLVLAVTAFLVATQPPLR